MKGTYTLAVAGCFGIVGALFNWAYLSSKARDIENVSFIGIKPDASIDRGERLTADSVEEVPIPKIAADKLGGYAFLWSELSSVENRPIWRTLGGGALLLRDDIRTPPPELDLGEGEDGIPIPVDTRTFVPSLVTPGQWISFKVPPLPPGPTLAVPAVGPKPEGPEGPSRTDPAAPMDVIGPFKVLSVGNRLSSPDVMRAAKIPQMQENIVMIRSSSKVAGEVQKADKLLSRVLATGFHQVAVVIHDLKSTKK
jgi:hypothetical protein